MKPDGYIWKPVQGDLCHVSLWPATSGYFRSIPLLDPSRIDQAWAILCNDGIEAVVIGSEKLACEQMELRRQIDFEKYLRINGKKGNEEEYGLRFYWRLRSVPAMIDVFE